MSATAPQLTWPLDNTLVLAAQAVRSGEAMSREELGVALRPDRIAAMPHITISYRRADSAANAGRIFDRLERRYGSDSVFMDIDAIPLGVNYKRYIDEALKKTDFMLVVVGPRWLGPRENGTLRIKDANDPVRIELEAAFRNNTTIIPILVDGASMPNPEDLPESLEEFAFIQAAEVATGRDFNAHVDHLTRFLDAAVAERQADEARRSATKLVPHGTGV